MRLRRGIDARARIRRLAHMYCIDSSTLPIFSCLSSETLLRISESACFCCDVICFEMLADSCRTSRPASALTSTFSWAASRIFCFCCVP